MALRPGGILLLGALLLVTCTDTAGLPQQSLQLANTGYRRIRFMSIIGSVLPLEASRIKEGQAVNVRCQRHPGILLDHLRLCTRAAPLNTSSLQLHRFAVVQVTAASYPARVASSKEPGLGSQNAQPVLAFSN